ncbi:MAG: T9SS type A sorting domain-containing protein [candidate division Zixibacteria bacterium]|nr:T9SS type A sorting domain-containing protein [candidate division Zixibacteria bacterium]
MKLCMQHSIGKITFLTVALAAFFLTQAMASGEPELVWIHDPQDGSVNSVDFSNDGQFIATCAEDFAKIWDASDGSLLHTFDGHDHSTVSVDISPNNEMLATGYVVIDYPPGGNTKYRDIESGTILFQGGGAYVSYSENGEYVAAGGGGINRYFRVFDAETGEEIMSAYTGNYIYDIAISPNASIVATCGSDNTIKLYNTRSGGLFDEFPGESNTLAFSPDGLYLASGASSIDIWRISDGELMRTIDAFSDNLFGLDYYPYGDVLISCGRDASLSTFSLEIKFWNTQDGSLMEFYDQPAYDVEFSADGLNFVFGSPYGELGVAHNPVHPPAVEIGMVPDDDPPIVAPPGGSFGFTGAITNIVDTMTVADVWGGVKYAGVFYELWEFPDIPLNPGQSISAHMNQNIPNNAPISYYYYLAYTGIKPDIIDSTYFTVRVEEEPLVRGSDDWILEGGWFQQTILSEYALISSYPNPFNAQTTITFDLPKSGKTNLEVYNVLGQQVATLVDRNLQAGQHSIKWDASEYSSGVYFYRLTAGDKVISKRMTLLK